MFDANLIDTTDWGGTLALEVICDIVWQGLCRGKHIYEIVCQRLCVTNPCTKQSVRVGPGQTVLWNKVMGSAFTNAIFTGQTGRDSPYVYPDFTRRTGRDSPYDCEKQ